MGMIAGGPGMIKRPGSDPGARARLCIFRMVLRYLGVSRGCNSTRYFMKCEGLFQCDEVDGNHYRSSYIHPHSQDVPYQSFSGQLAVVTGNMEFQNIHRPAPGKMHLTQVQHRRRYSSYSYEWWLPSNMLTWNLSYV